MKLNQIRDNEGARKVRTRVGRGYGSGKGRTAGRGVKGQTSRSGVAINGFEGGQMPIYRRLPKRGFTNIFRLDFVEVNLNRLQNAIDAGLLDASKEINAIALMEAGVIRRAKDGIRVLGKGELKAKINIRVAGISTKAKEAIEAVGGTVVIDTTRPGSEKEKSEEKAEKPVKKAPAKAKKASSASKKEV